VGHPHDAVLVVSFGGPEGPDDVVPFLENVLRGKNVPRERMLEVARHYDLFGGVSPANAQNRALVAALIDELNAYGPRLPVYWGNRAWHPLLADALARMRDDGIRNALAMVTSAYSSYSGCRQYLEDIERARAEVGAKSPQVAKLRVFYNHPGFVEAMIERTESAFDEIPDTGRRRAARLIFTAHSLPTAMADACPYVDQVTEACRLVSEGLAHDRWQLAYQNRSGPPSQPWLEPDVCDVLRQLAKAGSERDVVIAPIGFLSDHVEVVYELDIRAKQLCDQLGLHMVRAGTVGTHPRFVRMIRELIEERLSNNRSRLALGTHGPSHDVCPDDCCPRTRRGPPTSQSRG